MKLPTRIIGFALVILYFLVSIFTLSQYGVNWDEVHHLTRGQAYLYYFLTGKEHYDQKLFEEGVRHSFYQIPAYDFTKQKKIDGDHPVFMFFWVERYFGSFSALISLLSLVLYPLFYGESHFNVQKDIPEAVFYSSAIMTFYISYINRSAKWIILSALFFGFAWGTKFNILFMPFTLLFWLLIKENHTLFKKLLAQPRNVKIALFTYPFIGFSIFFFSWPHLWYDTVSNLLQVFGYYKDFGVAYVQSMPSSYYILGFNTYALQWIIYTTPLVILLFSITGIFYVFKKGFKETNKTSFLILFWLLIPIFRVTLPNTSIYGGVRQIMEYLPAMAILSGIGASYIASLLHYFTINSYKQWSSRAMKQSVKRLSQVAVQVLIISLFIPITFKIASLHPNESIYFNPIAGGLNGAAKKNIPGWGNSLGNTYRQGVQWLNTYAEKNAKVVLLFGNTSNIPQTLFREDIKFSNTYRSGPGRHGEYIIGVTHYIQEEHYQGRYAERFLNTVYEVKVESIPVLKIWKNNLEYSKPKFRKKEEKVKNFSIIKGENFIRVDLKQLIPVTRIYIHYKPDNCTPPTLGYFEYSILGNVWKREGVNFISLPFTTFINRTQPDENVLRYIMSAENIRFIQAVIQDKKSCILNNEVEIEVYRI